MKNQSWQHKTLSFLTYLYQDNAMRQRSQCIFQALVLLMLIATTASYGIAAEQTPCWTSDNKNGFCVPITSCNSMIWLLANSGNTPPAYVNDFVRRNHCGTYGNRHFVCCSSQYIRRTPQPQVQHSQQYLPNWQYPHTQHYTHHHYPLPVQNPPRLQYPYQYQHAAQYPVPPLQNPPTSTFYNPSPRLEPVTCPQHPWQHQNFPDTSTPNARCPEKIIQPSISVGEHILNSVPCGTVSGDRIANGEKAQLSEYPWMALLEFSETRSNYRFLCGGSLITERYILTAAHCVFDRNDLVGVRLGEHDLDTQTDCELGSSKKHRNCAPPVENIGIEQIITHPQYSARPLINDIALIRLIRNVQFKAHIKPICLPRTPQMVSYVPARAIISGWGITERGFASDELMKAEIPVKENSFCQNIFKRSLITPNHICAGGEYRKSTCRGDSGSPMFAVIDLGWPQIHYIQLGIVSGGDPDCGSRHNYPSIYTRISPYLGWITSVLRP